MLSGGVFAPGIPRLTSGARLLTGARLAARQQFPLQRAVQVVGQFIDDVPPQRLRLVVTRGRQIGGDVIGGHGC
jgi:hypothetical protein